VTLSRRRLRGRMGVSVAIATMLLLLMTVVLFGAVFWFVNEFQRPPVQPLGQFSASLTYGGPGCAPAQVCEVSVAHLSGPDLGGSYATQVGFYVASQADPAAFPPGPLTLAQGGVHTPTWGFGQTWTLNASTYGVSAPDNITVAVVASNQLVFRMVLEATTIGQAPYVSMSAVTPVGLSGAAARFNLTAQVQSSPLPLSSVVVTANICQLQGLGCSMVAMRYAPPTGLFYCVGTATLDPASGTYYLFVTASDQAGSTIATVPVAFAH
jgi:hypothetical protein